MAWELNSSAESSSSESSSESSVGQRVVVAPKRKVGRPRNCPIDFGAKDVAPAAVKGSGPSAAVAETCVDRLSLVIRPVGGGAGAAVGNMIAVGSKGKVGDDDARLLDRLYPPQQGE